jgi:secreted trypsin-like serine protease
MNSTNFALAAVFATFVTACSTDVSDVGADAIDAAIAENAGADEKAIVGGVDVAIADHPWQISLQQNGGHFCGGSIISDRWIMTAQHCIEGERASTLSILAGASRLSRAGEGQLRRVARIVPVSGYTTASRGKDMALLELTQPLSFTDRVQPIALATAADVAAGATAAGITATVTGWGSIRSGGSSPDALRGAAVPMVTLSQAQRVYRERLTDDQIAAGGNGRDSCQGDSGGPLTVDSPRGRLLVGVVSWGYGCGDPGVPGLYANVAFYAEWVASQTGISLGGSSAPTTPPPTSQTLIDEVHSGAAGSVVARTITVPAGTRVLTIAIAGGTGDADLYVRRGSAPTTSRFDCRPYTSTSTESCTFDAPTPGTWHIAVAGYSAYQDVELKAELR